MFVVPLLPPSVPVKLRGAGGQPFQRRGQTQGALQIKPRARPGVFVVREYVTQGVGTTHHNDTGSTGRGRGLQVEVEGDAPACFGRLRFDDLLVVMGVGGPEGPRPAPASRVPSRSSTRARSTIRGSPPRSTEATDATSRRRAARTFLISRSGVSCPGSTRSKYPRSAKRRARMSCSRTGSARGTSTARRRDERSSHTVEYPAIETTTSASA